MWAERMCVHDGMKYKPNRIRGPKYSSCALIPINITTPESVTNKISVLPQHNCEKRLLASSCLSVLFACPHWKSRLSVDRYLGYCVMGYLVEYVNKTDFFLNLTKITDTWYDDLSNSTLPPQLTLIVLEKNYQEKVVKKVQHMLHVIHFPENLAMCET